MYSHAYAIGERVERSSMVVGTVLWKSGTVVDCIPGAETYCVVFDHMWESEPVLTNGENLRPLNPKSVEAIHPNAKVLREWSEICRNVNEYGKSGDRVKYLHVDSANLYSVRIGYVNRILPNSSGARLVVDILDGKTRTVSMDNVRLAP